MKITPPAQALKIGTISNINVIGGGSKNALRKSNLGSYDYIFKWSTGSRLFDEVFES